MNVNYIRNKVQVLANLHGRFGKQRKTKRVVSIIPSGIVVDAGAAKKAVMFHKVNRHVLMKHGMVDSNPAFFPVSHVYAGCLLEGNVEPESIYGSIKRNHDAGVMPQRAQGLGQPGYNIGQPSRLGVRGAFGSR